MYCSNENGDDCTHLETLVRVGLPFTHFFGLEDLFYKVFWMIFKLQEALFTLSPYRSHLPTKDLKFPIFCFKSFNSMALTWKFGPMNIRTNVFGPSTNMKYSMDHMKSPIKTLEHQFTYVLPQYLTYIFPSPLHFLDFLCIFWILLIFFEFLPIFSNFHDFFGFLPMFSNFQEFFRFFRKFFEFIL